VIDPRLRSVVERILPRFLLIWLDPFQAIIESEVEEAAKHLHPNQVVLDAGAGEGRHGKRFERGRYIALDRGTGDPSWDYSCLDVIGDIETLPFRKNSVDCVLCMVVLEHTRNPGQVLKEFARVLKTDGKVYLVVPFLWEEHQIPNDYFRFTRYGIRSLFDGLPFRIELLQPMGGIFWLCARRSINLLTFLQGGWRWLFFVLLSPILGFILPILLYGLDGLDRAKTFSLGFRIRATKGGV
jgi:SAM-dependent methyltransferase